MPKWRRLVGWLEFNVHFQHKYGYIRDDKMAEEIDLQNYNSAIFGTPEAP